MKDLPRPGMEPRFPALAGRFPSTVPPEKSLFFIFKIPERFYFLISWRLITLQYCSGFCHTSTWISLGYTCIPHPDPPSHLPLRLIPLGLPSAPGLSTCLMHPTCAGDLFHYRYQKDLMCYFEGHLRASKNLKCIVLAWQTQSKERDLF